MSQQALNLWIHRGLPGARRLGGSWGIEREQFEAFLRHRAAHCAKNWYRSFGKAAVEAPGSDPSVSQDFITIADAVRHSGFTKSAVEGWVKRGVVSAVHVGTRRWLLSRASLDAWLLRRTEEPNLPGHITVGKAAEQAGTDRDTIRKWLKRGQVAGTTVDGNKMVESASLEAWLVRRAHHYRRRPEWIGGKGRKRVSASVQHRTEVRPQ